MTRFRLNVDIKLGTWFKFTPKSPEMTICSRQIWARHRDHMTLEYTKSEFVKDSFLSGISRQTQLCSVELIFLRNSNQNYKLEIFLQKCLQGAKREEVFKNAMNT